MWKELRVWATAWFVATLIAVPAGAADTSSAQPGNHYVRVPAKAAPGLTGLGLQAAGQIDYGSFVWMESSPGEFGRLRRSSVEFREEADAFVLDLGGLRFDPLAVPTVAGMLPAGLEAGRAAGPDLHLVQMVGPTKAEWLDALQANGLQVVQYIHPYTYVVWGEMNARDESAGLAEVRWAGSFAPAYRLQPRYRNLADRSDEVRVLLYRGADTGAVIDQIEALGGQYRGGGVLNNIFEIAGFELSTAKLGDVANIPGVYNARVVPKDGGLRGEMSDQVCANNVDGSNLAFPGYPAWLSAVGIDGNGVIIANVDGGVQNDHPDLINRLIACSGVTCGGSSTSSHGTHTAGIMAADGVSGTLDSYGFLRGLGMSPGANLVEQVYSPWYTQAGGMLLLMTDSYNNGGSLSGNSWGPAGTPQGYDDDTMQVDIGVRDADPNVTGNEPLSYVLSFMNGYGGTSSQGSPDEAKNIFNIGSTKMQTSGGAQILDIDDLSSNTAHGPALDGRTIPHMVAPGCYVDSTTSSSSYTTMCGTSMASPHVSGAVALFIEFYRNLPDYVSDPSPAMVKAAFLPVSRDLAGNQDADGGTLGHPFDSKQGWGRMDVEAVVDPSVNVWYYDNPMVFDSTGEEWNEAVAADDPSQPVRIMLVWTDAPGHGLGGSTPAWNNDLDLIVESGLDTYRGNNFGGDGWSATGGTADGMNNTEGVFIGPTAPGVYNIRVLASDVNSDAIPGVGDATDQDFALVCYNCGPAGPQPPTAEDTAANPAVSTPVTITLPSTDDGLPDPPAAVTTIITTLPAHGDLSDPGAGAITGVPYTLAGNGNQVDYQPDLDYAGPDEFEFKANDGGVPPEGGDSNTAVVTITVGGPAWDPVADDGEWTTGINVPLDITLVATDPNGDPLTYYIESLPALGSLSDPGAGAIGTVPYELVGGGKVVHYVPPVSQAPVETFDFSVRDATAGSNVATVTVNVGVPQAAHDFPMDIDPGWTTEGSWAFGQPTGGGSGSGDPNSGHTGNNVYGYNLTGDYANSLPVRYLTTTAIDCSNLTGVEVRFWRWLGVESSWFDHANVQVSNNGSDWTTLWQNGTSTINESSWSQRVYDISAVADEEPTVYLRWGMGPTDNSNTYAGWNIDDLEIWAVVWGGQASCTNSILDPGEDRIDCGGPCPPCDCTSDAECDNATYCDGAETCDAYGTCQAGTPVDCPDDGLYCNGTEFCDEGADACASTGDPCTDDGLYCNGTESCDEVGDQCVSSGDPCTDDGLYCNGTESCDEVGDQCVSSGDPCTDDGLYCNGTESCDEVGDQCVSSGDPCTDDGLYCNGTEFCDEGGDVCDSTGDPCTDDGLFCNGTEFCDEGADICDSTGDPCSTDGLYCNGSEFCVEDGDTCGHDGNPCFPPTECDEVNDTCFLPGTTIDSAAACRDQGGTEYCLDLAVSGAATVEPRQGGVIHLVLQAADLVPDDTVTAWAICENNTHTGTITVTSDYTMTVLVDLDPLPDQDCCTIHFTGGIEDSLSVRLLESDVNGDGSVSTADASSIKQRLGVLVGGSDFWYDVNADGNISTADGSSVKQRLGNFAPICP
ncbi:MAG TPA: S8 family serine peptidase [Phycisphaerae bacterium]|nr:S8 family serine peptidase [Phycisphaerae bacterium]